MSGRAVVGVDVGPAAETLGDAGVLVPPDDPAELATACVDLLRAPARRRALGDAARRRALAYFTPTGWCGSTARSTPTWPAAARPRADPAVPHTGRLSDVAG